MTAVAPVSAVYPQVRIISIRMLKPETCERLLNKIVEIPGIRRVLLHGQNIPKVIPYGPARGMENTNDLRRSITVGSTSFDIRMLVGDIILELEDECVIGLIRRTCEEFFVKFGFSIQKGTFIKPTQTMVDYAKYGSHADASLIGMADPRSREKPVLVEPVEEFHSHLPRCENDALEG